LGQQFPKVHWADLDDGFRIDINAEKDKIIAGALPFTVFNSDYMISSF
jgi:hypothetical protein